MDCMEFERLLDDYLDGELPPARRAVFERHADDCAGCGRIRSDSVTLRRRLQAELSPLEPDAVDAFHEYKRNIALKEDSITPKRRIGVARAFGLAGAFLVLITLFLVQVPVSYSLPDGMTIAITFDPPLTEAPTFNGLILPKEFFDALSTDETLIESFTTTQGPEGLTSIEIGISSFDPEVAAKIAQGLITNYPALEAGEVEYRGREEDKHKPVIVMIKDKYKTDDSLTDQEIKHRIMLKMPDIEKWACENILPLAEGICIEIEGTNGDIEDIEKKLNIKIFAMKPGDESDEKGATVRKFIISEGGDDMKTLDIFKDFYIDGNCLGYGSDLITEEELKALQAGEMTKEELLDILKERIPGDFKAFAPKSISIYKDGKNISLGEGGYSKDISGIDIDDELLRKFADGEVSAEEFKKQLADVCKKQDIPGYKMKIIKLEDGKLEISDIPGILDYYKFLDSDVDGQFSKDGCTLDKLKKLDFDLQFLDDIDWDKLDAEDSKLTDEQKKELKETLKELCDLYSGLSGKCEKDGSSLKDEYAWNKDGSAYSGAGAEKKLIVRVRVDNCPTLEGGDKSIEIDNLITTDEMKQLKDTSLKPDDFTSVLHDRLSKLGYLECDMSIQITDDEASYNIKIKDGEVKFEFKLLT